MNKKGIDNIWYFALSIFFIMFVALLWVSTATPLEYTVETGRKQAILFNMYITAEQIRNYVEESARLSTFYALRQMEVPIDRADCFADVDGKIEFSEIHFTLAMRKYLELYSLENMYSDVNPPLYGVFYWNPAHTPPVSERGTLADEATHSTAAKSRLYVPPIDGGTKIRITGTADGDIQIINQRYSVIYSASPTFEIEVTCQEYEDFMEDL
ncbi:MAG: hypothetical protein JSW73_04900 [Candidatus Woesearchaeota archaeon]|nr:MAG: hypothetical protein JSW73_04900 [Candidatus Woesearchaeota archaeon]